MPSRVTRKLFGLSASKNSLLYCKIVLLTSIFWFLCDVLILFHFSAPQNSLSAAEDHQPIIAEQVEKPKQVRALEAQNAIIDSAKDATAKKLDEKGHLAENAPAELVKKDSENGNAAGQPIEADKKQPMGEEKDQPIRKDNVKDGGGSGDHFNDEEPEKEVQVPAQKKTFGNEYYIAMDITQLSLGCANQFQYKTNNILLTRGNINKNFVHA